MFRWNGCNGKRPYLYRIMNSVQLNTGRPRVAPRPKQVMKTAFYRLNGRRGCVKGNRILLYIIIHSKIIYTRNMIHVFMGNEYGIYLSNARRNALKPKFWPDIDYQRKTVLLNPRRTTASHIPRVGNKLSFVEAARNGYPHGGSATQDGTLHSKSPHFSWILDVSCN